MASNFQQGQAVNAGTVATLLNKLGDPDPDYRFMSLNDLLGVLVVCKPEFLGNNFNIAARCIDNCIKALDDSNGEVQNLAIKCLAPLSTKAPSNAIGPMIEKLSNLELKNSVDMAVPALALRTVVTSLPHPIAGVAPTSDVLTAYDAISRVLVPRLIGPVNETSAQKHTKLPLPSAGTGLLKNMKTVNPDIVDVLIEVVRCFGPLLIEQEVVGMQGAITKLLDTESCSSAVKRRAVVAISILAPYLSESDLDAMVKSMAKTLAQPDVHSTTRRNYITIMGSMARSIPTRFGQYLSTLLPSIFTALGSEELEHLYEQVSEGTANTQDFNEVRESALVALEAFLASCPTEMESYTTETVASALRYLKYDPNTTLEDDDEDMEDDEGDEDEDEDDDEFDDEDDDFDDDDDTSWKVRRCAAKVIYTLIFMKANELLENGILYQQAAPALIKRLEEREENVRLEVISVLSLLIRKTGEGLYPMDLSLDEFEPEIVIREPISRKRRRQSSAGVSAMVLGVTSPIAEKLPPTGPRADLARLTPGLIKQSAKLLKGKMIPSKQATIKLLDDLLCTQRSSMGDALNTVMDHIIEAIKMTGTGTVTSSLAAAGGNASATATTLRMAALKLVSDIAKTHSSSVIQPYLPKMVEAVVCAAKDRFYKVSGEAIRTAQELVKVITPPRSRANGQKFKAELGQLYDTIMERTSASDADLEVRHRAIHALAILLSRASNLDTTWISAEDKSTALNVILDRLKNETTRLAAVRAVDTIAASTGNLQFGQKWTHDVAVELAAQLRKANRALKVSSIQALKRLLNSPATKGQLDKSTIESIIPSLLPAISTSDTHVLGSSLLILANVAREHPDLAVAPEVTAALRDLLTSNLASIAIDQILSLITNVGESGQGQALMGVLLQDVSIAGDPTVVGKVIGALLVSSGSSAGVSVNDFISELQTSAKKNDENRVSLALAVLGEIGMRMGTESPLKPELFLEQFHPEPDKVSLAAAAALGRAGCGNVAVYLPVILTKMEEGGNTQYLLILSIKEVLQQITELSNHIRQHASAIWDHLLKASMNMDNKVVCAECVGRLVILEPALFMPKLQILLQDSSPIVRAMAVQAVRYSLPESDETFDAMLKNVLFDMILTMLKDSDMEIRRLALTTLNSAAHNKPDLILPHLPQLMPFVFAETVINQSLIREVKLGPFTHIVDDGLELRKSAYDTLYALMETAFSRINTKDFYDRVIAGLADDNDIRALCNIMVSKLVVLRPEDTAHRLDAIAECYRKILTVKLKDNAVKQDYEKLEEARKSVLRVTLLLGDRLKVAIPGPGTGAGAHNAANPCPIWTQYWEWVHKDFDGQLKKLREENRALQTTM